MQKSVPILGTISQFLRLVHILTNGLNQIQQFRVLLQVLLRLPQRDIIKLGQLLEVVVLPLIV